MSRFDRILGIHLLLRSGKSVSASEIARRFEVSRRTVYRDIDALSALGVPVYAERGRDGGFRLIEGYSLPPVMFSEKEAISLVMGLTLLDSLSSRPFADEMETAEAKLLAALPNRLRTILAEARSIIGFEGAPRDTFHFDLSDSELAPDLAAFQASHQMQSQTISIFLQAVLEKEMLLMEYHSPYRGKTKRYTVEPLGMFWDRNFWYLVGDRHEHPGETRLFRADRVLKIRSLGRPSQDNAPFDVRSLLNRNWLKSAMANWIEETPVSIRITELQAIRLKKDWYYRHAVYEKLAENEVLLTFGEDNQEAVLELLRWLGPDAEIIEPEKWRDAIRDELEQMLAQYGKD